MRLGFRRAILYVVVSFLGVFHGQSQSSAKRLAYLDEQLPVAAASGDMIVAGRLVAEGANVNTRTEAGGVTPLMLAAGRERAGPAGPGGHSVVVRFLLRNGAIVDAKDKRGQTVLLYALPAQHLEAAKELIAKGANVNVQEDTDGASPFGVAAGLGDAKMVRLLIENGADPNTRSKSGMTAAMIAIRNN